MIWKNPEGEVRLIWLLLLLVIPFLLAAYLLRYIPIGIQKSILINQGLSELTALSQARTIFLDEPIGSSLVGIIQGLLWYPLVWFLIRRVNKQSCELKSLGLNLEAKKFRLIPLGVILGLVMYFGYFLVGSFFSLGYFVWSPVDMGAIRNSPCILEFYYQWVWRGNRLSSILARSVNSSSWGLDRHYHGQRFICTSSLVDPSFLSQLFGCHDLAGIHLRYSLCLDRFDFPFRNNACRIQFNTTVITTMAFRCWNDQYQ